MKSDPETTFNEQAWNDKRLKLEERVRQTTLALQRYMGCNKFTLTFNGFKVEVGPSDSL